MKKSLPIVLVIVVLVIFASLTISIKQTRTIDWEETFDEKSNKPYGLSIFYKELPKIFKDYKVRTVFHQPSSYLRANSEDSYGDHVAEGSFIIIGNSCYLEDDSVEELLRFVDDGNTLFISDYYYPKKLQDTLGLDIDYIINEKKDSTSYLSLSYFNLKSIKIDKNEGDSYFANTNEISATILGHSKIEYKHPNFIKIPFGKGDIFLHTEPKAFTNYNLLKEERYKYVEGLISYLPENDVYFDSYIKIQSSYGSDVKKESNLSWFLQQMSFKWAWYTALIFGVLFMIFNAKRRQRIIKIIKPLQNTTVGFVKTVSNLYFETQDHKNLIDKKITYFLEKIRTDYNMDTSILDDEFIERLASKSGKNIETIKKLIRYINWLRTKNEFFEENLVKLNRHIEAFYSK